MSAIEKTVLSIRNYPAHLYFEGLVTENELPEMRRRANLAAYWWLEGLITEQDAMRYAVGGGI